MTANLLNTLVGLWLAHTAIFPNALLGMSRDRLVLIAAVATIVLALWARRSDVSTWQSNTAVVTGVLLVILTVADQVTSISDVLMFWSLLWAGLVSATVSLWAALYRPPQAASAAD